MAPWSDFRVMAVSLAAIAVALWVIIGALLCARWGKRRRRVNDFGDVN